MLDASVTRAPPPYQIMAEIVPASETNLEQLNSATEEMDIENVRSVGDGSSGAEEPVTNGEVNTKRPRNDDDKAQQSDEVAKKLKIENSAEETRLRLENLDDGSEEADKVRCGRVSLGPKSFESAVEMFDYFYKFLHYWPPNLNVNKYEQMVLLDLLKKGHPEPEKKMRGGIRSFQVRYHPTWKSRCFFLIREDASVDDFSLRKCVDLILPLPEDMKIKHDANKALGGGVKHCGGRRGGRGRGNWTKSTN